MKKFILFFSIACQISTLLGQDLPTVIPQSPAASSLAKYCEFPVSSFTGVPDINLPLMTVESGDLSIPLQLNYNAAGFRVTEEASWVGLGWTLSTDAMISRTIHGVDDFTGGMLNNRYAVPNNYLSPFTPRMIDISGGVQYYQWVCYFGGPPNGDNGFNWGSPCKGAYSYCRSNYPKVNGYTSSVNYFSEYPSSFDWEPDAFFINFFGNNNIFVYDQDRKIHFVNKSDIEITKTTNGWKVRTNNGFEYQFEKQILAKNEFQLEVSSEWYLTKIISPLKHEARFIYTSFNKNEPGNFITNYSFSESAYSLPSDNCPKQYSLEPIQVQVTRYLKNYLERIELDNGTYIQFIRDTQNRQDLKNAEKLKYIRVYDLNNTLVREFDLRSDYFNTNNNTRGLAIDMSDADYSYFQKRLKLTNVIERKGSITKVNSFEYSDIALPNKDSFKQDHWGFYNNNSSYTLIPAYEGKLLFKYSTPPVYGENYMYRKYFGANRESDSSLMKACILTKIIYPTGGYTSFKFEANDYLLPEALQYTPSDYSTCINDPVPVVYGFYNISKDIRAIGSGNGVVSYFANSIETDSITFPIPASVDEGPIESKIEITVYATGSGDITLNSGMLAKIVGSNFNQEVCLNNLECTSTGSPCYSYRKVIILPENIIGPITMKLTMPGAINPQTAVFAFSSQLYKLTRGNKFAGGLRIKKITHHDPSNPLNNLIKTYQYSSPFQDENNQTVLRSTGVLKKPLRYYYMMAPPAGSTSKMCFTSSSYYGSGYEMGNHIGYSKIKEYSGANGEFGYTESIFYNQRNILYNSPIRPVGVPSSYRNMFDGKLYKKSIYDKDNHLLNETTYGYAILEEKIIKGIYQDYYGAEDDQYGQGGFHYYPIYTRWEVLDNDSTKTYNVDKSNYITIDNHYHYNRVNLLPMVVITYTSEGDKIVTSNAYPPDVTTANSLSGGSFSTNEFNMINQLKGIYENDTVSFRTSEVIQKEVLRNNILVSRQRTIYDSSMLNVLPKYQKFAFNNNIFETRIQFNQYDNKGNILEVEKTGDMKIAYMWSYNNSYPVIKAENTSYDTLNTAVSSIQTSLQTFLTNSVGDLTTTQQKTDWKDFNNSLRSKSSLVNSMISTYTYKPLIGITSETDPNGITTYYEYDELGRLKLIRNDDGNILKSFEYKYSQQAYYNIALSQPFSRNNCGWGYNGSTVTYSVPADKYVSLSSQTDANSKALAEITQNGQNNANTYGNCSPAVSINVILPPGYTAQIYATVSGSSKTFSNVTSGSTIVVPKGTGSLNITLSGCSGNHMYSLMGLATTNSGCQGTLSNLSLQSSSYMLIISKM